MEGAVHKPRQHFLAEFWQPPPSRQQFQLPLLYIVFFWLFWIEIQKQKSSHFDYKKLKNLINMYESSSLDWTLYKFTLLA